MLLDLIHRLLDVDEDDGPRRLIEAARRVQPSLEFMILSLLEQEQVRFGPASRDALARARTRSDQLEELAAELLERTACSLMKGPVIARLYPPGVLRPSVDLDVVFRDETALWEAARWLVERRPVDDVAVSVIGSAPRHVVVATRWESTDPLVDPSIGVDLATAALAGDLQVVPARAELPADPVVGALLSVAEERFQRPFVPRDVLDVVMLDAAGLPAPAEVVAAIDAYRLAPETDELLGYAAAHAPLGSLDVVREALPPLAERERARRAATPADRAGDDVAERLEAGLAAYGFPLGPTRGNDRTESTLVEFPAGHLLRTPLGDYLLTGGATVGLTAYEAALRFCAAEPDLG